jgi:hypothetical protein
MKCAKVILTVSRPGSALRLHFVIFASSTHYVCHEANHLLSSSDVSFIFQPHMERMREHIREEDLIQETHLDQM